MILFNPDLLIFAQIYQFFVNKSITTITFVTYELTKTLVLAFCGIIIFCIPRHCLLHMIVLMVLAQLTLGEYIKSISFLSHRHATLDLGECRTIYILY